MDREQVVLQELGVGEALEDLQVHKAVEGLDPHLQDAAMPVSNGGLRHTWCRLDSTVLQPRAVKAARTVLLG